MLGCDEAGTIDFHCVLRNIRTRSRENSSEDETELANGGKVCGREGRTVRWGKDETDVGRKRKKEAIKKRENRLGPPRRETRRRNENGKKKARNGSEERQGARHDVMNQEKGMKIKEKEEETEPKDKDERVKSFGGENEEEDEEEARR